MRKSGDLLGVHDIFHFEAMENRFYNAEIRLRQFFITAAAFLFCVFNLRLSEMAAPPCSPLFAINVVDCPRPREQRWFGTDAEQSVPNLVCYKLVLKSPPFGTFKYTFWRMRI